MSFNQVSNYCQGYIQSVGTSQGIIAGLIGLSIKGSTSLAGICTDNSGNIYVADPIRHIILKIQESGNIINLAGLSGTASNNGDATVTCIDARFNYPTAVVCDKNGDLYIADSHNHQIRKISNNKVSLVAGASVPTPGTADGVRDTARFNTPVDLDIDNNGVLYIADCFNHAIRKIVGGVVTTIAGAKGTWGNAPVWAQMTTAQGITGTAARFKYPYSIAVSPTGFVFVGDGDNHCIKRIDPDGWVRIFSGSGTYGTALGTAKTCQYQDLKFSDIGNKSSDLYIIDFDEAGASRLLRIDEDGVPGVIIYFTASEGPYAVSVACNPADHLIVVESDYTIVEYSSSSSSSTSSSSSSIDSSSSSSSSSSISSNSSSSNSSSSSSSISSNSSSSNSSSSSSSLRYSSSSSSSSSNSSSSNSSSSSSSKHQ